MTGLVIVEADMQDDEEVESGVDGAEEVEDDDDADDDDDG